MDPPEDSKPPLDAENKPQAESDFVVPGADDEAPKKNSDHSDDSHHWNDFESQFSIAVSQSAMVPREQWGNQCEFLMSCIASAVGLGNIWRFPFIAGQNGGGAFLIPYLLVLTVIGRPLYLMELGLGQFASAGPIKIWELCPAFRGVGYGAALASFFVTTFYVCVMGWALVYFLGYSWTLPWRSPEYHNNPGIFFGTGHLNAPNKTDNETDFFLNKGLDGSPGVPTTMGLLFAWFLVWAVMVGGVSGSGKIAYFTALFPYFVLLILLIFGCQLENAGEGIKYFFNPDFEHLLSGKTWFQAVGQCFFSLGITFGGCITFASYNTFHHTLGRDILIISIMDTFTSLLAGTCLFALIGNLADRQAKETQGKNTSLDFIKEISSHAGAGMAFITFPAVLQAFPPRVDNFICLLFFFMIVVLAVGSANGLLGTVVTVICDQRPRWNRKFVVTGLCIVCFFFGLIYTTPTGSNVIDIVDKHGSEIPIFFVSILETIGVAWIYGIQNLCNDFEFMLGSRVNIYWVVSWAILPFLLVIIFAAYLINYEKDPKWPSSAIASACTLSALSCCVPFIVAFFVIRSRKSSQFRKRVKASFYPSRKWGPKDPLVREAWRRFKRTRPTELLATTWLLRILRVPRRYDDVPASELGTADLESQFISTTATTTPPAEVTPAVSEGQAPPAPEEPLPANYSK